MAVNPKLFDAIRRTLGVSARQVNRLIERTASQNHLPRDLAALRIGSERGVPIHRYATREQLAELRGMRGQAEQTPPPARPSVNAPEPRQARKPPRPSRNNSIFVVHGRDEKLTADMYDFLRSIGLVPIEWDHAIKAATRGGANPIVGDVIDNAMKKAQGILVLLSPDEQAKLKPKYVGAKDRKHGLHVLDGQPRPNVILEAGIALGAHSDKTILVQVGDIRDISDIAGKHMVHLTNSPAKRKALADRLRDKLKFKVDLAGSHWLDVGNFDR